MTPRTITKRFIGQNVSQSLRLALEMPTDAPLRMVGAEAFGWNYGNLRTAGSGCRGGFLGGLGCRGGLAATLGLWRSRGRFADQFGRHDARYEQLGAVIVKIHGGAFLVGSGHDTQAVHSMLNSLTFLHHLHNVLLDRSR